MPIRTNNKTLTMGRERWCNCAKQNRNQTKPNQTEQNQNSAALNVSLATFSQWFYMTNAQNISFYCVQFYRYLMCVIEANLRIFNLQFSQIYLSNSHVSSLITVKNIARIAHKAVAFSLNLFFFTTKCCDLGHHFRSSAIQSKSAFNLTEVNFRSSFLKLRKGSAFGYQFWPLGILSSRVEHLSNFSNST